MTVYQERRCLNTDCNYLWDTLNLPGHVLCPKCGHESRRNCAHTAGISFGGKPESTKCNIDHRIWEQE
jgi:hypothetical protein